MRTLRALRALARVELREARRHRGRSLLLLTLVGIPVAAMVGGLTLVRIIQPTAAELAAQAMGRADLRVDVSASYERRAELSSLLPPGAGMRLVIEGRETVSVPGRTLQAKLLAFGPETVNNAHLNDGMILLQEGCLPRNAGEVALSTVLLESLARRVGDPVVLEYGGPRRITGIVADPERLDMPLVVRTPAASEYRVRRFALIGGLDTSATASLASSLQSFGFVLRTRADAAATDPFLTAIMFALGALGLLEAALVIAAAFAISLRRRQYEIGLLASNGASGRDLTGAVLASGGATACLGGLLGALAGLVVAGSLMPFLDGWNGRWNGPFEFSLTEILLCIGLGIIAAVLATIWPARSAARLPIRVALSGRRPPAGRSAGWLAIGLAMIGGGLLLMLLTPESPQILSGTAAVLGPMLCIFGFGVASPWVLGFLAGRATRLPVAWRLAVRDAGRFRYRNGPVVSAVLAGMAMAVTLAVLVSSLETTTGTTPVALRDDQLLITGPAAEAAANRLALMVNAVAVAPLRALYCDGQPVRARVAGGPARLSGREEWIACGDAQLLAALGASTDAARAAFDRDELLVFRPPEADQAVTLATWLDDRRLPTPTVFELTLDQAVQSPVQLLSDPARTASGWDTGPPPRRTLTPWLVRLDAPVTSTTLDLARDLAAANPGLSVDAALLHRDPGRAFFQVVLGVCILAGLGIVLTATALSAAESEADARILVTVGASPAFARRHAAARASYLALLGCILAIPGGLMPVLRLFRSEDFPLDLVIPWTDLALIALALPVASYLASWFAAGRHRRTAKALASGRPRPLSSLAPALIAILIAGSGLVPAAAAPPPTITWEPYAGHAFDGSPLLGELGRIRVPENRADPDGSTIEIAFVRYRTTHPDPGPPIFFLAGGPGASGVEYATVPATHPQMRLLEQADIIGIDQRGTGLSRPDLTTEEFRGTLPLGRPVDRDDVLAAAARTAAHCAAAWTARGVDLSAYNTRESADDVEAVRSALELESIVLYGVSYGSHLGLAYLKRHPDHVARAFLSRVEGPDDTWKLPSTTQASLEALQAEVLRDAMLRTHLPDLLGTVQSLLDTLAAAPVTAAVPGDSAATTVVLGPYDLQVYLARALSESQTIAMIPSRLLSARAGDWSWLAAEAVADRSLAFSAMPLLMDCASGGTPARLERIERERRDPRNLLADAILHPLYPGVGDAVGAMNLGDTYRSAPHAEMPVLFVSGSHDARTPPANVAAIRDGFPRSLHVVADGAGHDAREFMAAEYRELFQAFFRGDRDPDPMINGAGAGATVQIELPPIRFER